MDIHEFGTENEKKIMLIPGNMMSWRQFKDVAPILAENYHVIAVSIDGYDDTGRTIFTTAHESAAQLADYIDEHLDGSIDLVFGESFGSAVALALFHDFKWKAKSMILSGPQYFSFGPLNSVFKWYIPKNQYRLCSKVRYMKKAPLLLKLFTGNDEETLNGMFYGMAENISLETLRNAIDEAFVLYRECSNYNPEPAAHIAVWYGEKERNMKEAIRAIRQIYPNAEIREFKGCGHGEILLYPELMTEEIIRFMNDRKDGQERGGREMLTKAGKILKSKKWAKEELDRSFPKEQSDSIWKAAHDRLEGYLEEYADIPEGERMHTDSRIFPMAAIYLSIKEVAGEEFAFDFMERFCIHRCEGLAKMLAGLMHVPGMKDLFVSIWDPMTRKMFGPASGFSNRFYDNPKGEYRMDVTSCPYNRYLTLLGCPEVTKLFCANDDRMYGNLPGIDFIRTKTIGRGGDCCDFYMRKSFKIDYKNWIPKGMIAGLAAGTAVLAGANIAVWKNLKLSDRKADIAVKVVLGAGLAACAKATEWSIMAYREFSYNGKRQLSREIIEGTAEHVKIPEGGIGLDVGCGSGALTIACAKRNPDAEMVGLDRWGAEYASFSKRLCEKNAESEGVTNASFCKGDAVKLDYPDETFDAVTSNYVYHNIVGADKQQLLHETLRVLKKGGVFAIHDIMSKSRYGDIDRFVEELRAEGYEEVNLIPTDDGLFMSKSEARRMMLTGSTLLVGRK